jgi:hypothetical protein
MVASSAAAGGSKRRNIGYSSKRRRAQTNPESREGGPGSQQTPSKKGGPGSQQTPSKKEGPGSQQTPSKKAGKPKPKPKPKTPKTNAPTPAMFQSGSSGRPKTGGAQKSCKSDNDCGNVNNYYCATQKSICCKRNEVCKIEGAPESGGSGFTQSPGASVIVGGLITAIALNF